MSHPSITKPRSLLLVLSLSAVAAAVLPTRGAYAGGQVDCNKLKDTKAFCEAVGGKEASFKRIMKDAEKAYKAAGNPDIECKSCHKGSNGGELLSEAKDLWPKYKPFVETAIKNYKK